MTEIWAVAHPVHGTVYRDTKQQALALVDAWTTERNAAICWPMTVEEDELEPCESCGAARNEPCLEWCNEMVDCRSIP